MTVAGSRAPAGADRPGAADGDREACGRQPADSAGTRWAGRELSSSPFARDDGAADPALVAALAAHLRGEASLDEVVDALRGARVLVPVVAHRDGRIPGWRGLPTDHESTAGIVALEAPDGRSVLPVFSSVETMAGWQADARPVPARADRAALAAVEEGWDLVVLDPHDGGGVLLPRPAVWALAEGVPWRPAVGAGGVDREVETAIVDSLADLEPLRQVTVEPGQRAEVAVALHLPAGLDRTALESLTRAVNARLAASGVVSARVDSLELRLREVEPAEA